MDLELSGKVALVTGGAKGIGAAIVRAFSREGAKVAIVDKDGPTAQSLAQEIAAEGGVAGVFAGDLTEQSTCSRAVNDTVRMFGKLDVLVNNAGVNDSVGLDATPEEFVLSLGRNLVHVFAMAHFAVPHLRASGGSIVNITSKVSVTGQGATSGYAAAKGGVNALTREWAAALARDAIRVNCVAPAECLTPQYENWMQAQPNPAEARQTIEQLVPFGRRMTRPEEIADAVLFLASKRASHITGQILFVDGGYTHLDRALDEAGGAEPLWSKSQTKIENG